MSTARHHAEWRSLRLTRTPQPRLFPVAVVFLVPERLT